MRTKNDWTQSAEKDRREIAKRVFDALSAAYPEKRHALVQPREPIAAAPNET